MLQLPTPNPAQVESAEGVAVISTTDPTLNACEHVAPQLSPAGALTNVPVPVPNLVRLINAVIGVYVAVTFFAADIATRQTLADGLESHPVQPLSVYPKEVTLVRSTVVVGENVLAFCVAHVVLQLMPAGAEVMVPPAAMVFVKLSVKFAA